MWKAITFYWLGFAMGSMSGRQKCEQYYYDYYYVSKSAVGSSSTTKSSSVSGSNSIS